jgi:hypothetical protein
VRTSRGFAAGQNLGNRRGIANEFLVFISKPARVFPAIARATLVGRGRSAGGGLGGWYVFFFH